MPAYVLALQDLYNRIPANVVRGYFDDAGKGSICEDDDHVQDVLMAAEGELYSRLMRAWGGQPSDYQGALQKIIQNDPTLRMHLGWVACELACERRVEFTDALGNGAYKAQYDRAISYFENVSKGALRSPGELAGGGRNQVADGSSSPDVASVASDFMFAPGRNNPYGPGGF